MSLSNLARLKFTALVIVVWAALQGTGLQAQQRGGTVQTDKVAAREQRRRPYRVIRDWAHLS